MFHLYVGALRPRMDFKTGIVGRRVRISYQALKEWTERAGRSGVRFLAHDKSKLQRMLARLQQLGLLRKMGGPFDLVFVCPLADRDNCDQKQADTESIRISTADESKQGKGSRPIRRTAKNAEAATHQESGKTLKPTPPTPSGVRPEEGGYIDPPAPAALEAANTKIDETPIDPNGQQFSEQRHENVNVGGKRPAAGRSDEGAKPVVTWEPHLDWPTGITQQQRAYIARRMAGLSETLAQRVLDEWHGATQAGTAKKPWPYLSGLVRNVQKQGEAWQTVYADQVAEARAVERRRMAEQQERELAHAARIKAEVATGGGGLSGPTSRRGDLVKFQLQSVAASQAKRERRRK